MELSRCTPLNTVYRYYGTGDVGGSPTIASVASVEKGIKGDGPLKIISATSASCLRITNHMTLIPSSPYLTANC